MATAVIALVATGQAAAGLPGPSTTPPGPSVLTPLGTERSYGNAVGSIGSERSHDAGVAAHGSGKALGRHHADEGCRHADDAPGRSGWRSVCPECAGVSAERPRELSDDSGEGSVLAGRYRLPRLDLWGAARPELWSGPAAAGATVVGTLARTTATVASTTTGSASQVAVRTISPGGRPLPCGRRSPLRPQRSPTQPLSVSIAPSTGTHWDSDGSVPGASV